MLNLHLFYSFCLLATIISFTPGPNVLLMIKYGMEYKLKEALIPIPGIALALLTYAILVAFGLSKILSQYPKLYHIISISGACYLIYMGANGLYSLYLKNKCWQVPDAAENKACRIKLFTSGYLCALTNPKILIIYLAFLPQFIDHSLEAFPQFLCLGLTHILIVMTSMLTYCVMANKSQNYIKKYSRIQTTLTQCILIGLGIYLLLEV